jgi:hypothetical protein
MIHWAEKRAMSANATVLAYLGRAQSEELPHTFPILQTVRCGVMSRISKEARLPPPDSVHGVLPLSDVKASRPQQAGCCIVISQPLIQLIARLPQDRVVSSRAEADRWLLIAPCCESTPVPEWLGFESPPALRLGEESLRILPSRGHEPQAAALQEVRLRRSERTATGNW